MQVGLGWLCLPPAAFWQMTPREFAAALEGWMALKGLGGQSAGLSHSESEAVRAFLAEDPSEPMVSDRVHEVNRTEM